MPIRSQPLAEVGVEARRPTLVNGQWTRGSVAASSITNDLGQARLFGLPPGEYFLSAYSTAVATWRGPENAVITYFPGSLAAQEATRIAVAAVQETAVTMPLLGQELLKTVSASAAIPTAPAGTARIRGRVVTAETNRGLAGAAVRIVGGGLRLPRIVLTGPDGRYEIDSVPPGRYTLSATKPGYAVQDYGQGGAAGFVDLVNDQTVDEVSLALEKGGVIVVRVTDESGEPLIDVTVGPEHYQATRDGRRLVPVLPAPDYPRTDDRGEVRLFGLPQGDYSIRARPGGLVPITPTMAASQGRSYVPTYFPGTSAPERAQSVAVQTGREIDVSLPLLLR